LFFGQLKNEHVFALLIGWGIERVEHELEIILQFFTVAGIGFPSGIIDIGSSGKTDNIGIRFRSGLTVNRKFLKEMVLGLSMGAPSSSTFIFNEPNVCYIGFRQIHAKI
jgi:hypothetical protein